MGRIRWCWGLRRLAPPPDPGELTPKGKRERGQVTAQGRQVSSRLWRDLNRQESAGACGESLSSGMPCADPLSFLGFFLNFFVFFNFLFIYFWVCWVFVSVRGLSPVPASGGHSSSRCAGLSLSRPLLLRSTGSRRAGSVVVAHGPSCSAACGIFPDQGSNPCPLHWQADS